MSVSESESERESVFVFSHYSYYYSYVLICVAYRHPFIGLVLGPRGNTHFTTHFTTTDSMYVSHTGTPS